MIREVTLEDAAAIAAIYNEYVSNTVITFDTVPVAEEEMRERIAALSARYPYYVYEEEGKVEGYCYVHPWKQRDAYYYTLETTVYVHPACRGKGIGGALMNRLIETCRSRSFHVLIACITVPNEASEKLHTRLGFRQVSLFTEVGRKFDRWLDVADYELKL